MSQTHHGALPVGARLNLNVPERSRSNPLWLWPAGAAGVMLIVAVVLLRH